MPRFFVPSENFDGSLVKIIGSDARHIARALRMAVGDELTVCDMHGGAHRCVLTKIRDEFCELQILESEIANTESPARISLYMGYPKGDKLEFIVQKAVELGANLVVPFASSRCVKRPKADREEKQTERLVKIADEASKQCGRTVLTKISPSVTFDVALKLANERGEKILFCYEGDGTVGIKSILNNIGKEEKLAIFVGPEGGFSIDEVNKAKSVGAILTGLGPRILRCETAPLYALSAISYELET
jgi:16S rRNA (uracil1498-N3)-methyltransferase